MSLDLHEVMSPLTRVVEKQVSAHAGGFLGV